MINCFVIGEMNTIEPVCRYITDYPETMLSGYSSQVPDNLDVFYRFRQDIVFVDTALLKDADGWLEEIKQFCSIVLISPSAERAFDAFEYAAFDYMVSPVLFGRFLKSINKFYHLMRLARSVSEPVKEVKIDSFFVKADSKGFKEVLIKCDQLIYIQALQNYVVLHMENNQRYSCHNSMKEMEESLAGSSFTRIHKSFIINEQKITSVEGNTVTLNNSIAHQLLIGNTYRKAFFEKKNQKVIKRRNTTALITYSKLAGSLLGFGLLIEEIAGIVTFTIV